MAAGAGRLSVAKARDAAQQRAATGRLALEKTPPPHKLLMPAVFIKGEVLAALPLSWAHHYVYLLLIFFFLGAS